ncbi:MAG: chromate resistance protein [Vicinamibacteria bacterium]|nr:chromate resistance protein [Vicinamibacteria bacterium]
MNASTVSSAELVQRLQSPAGPVVIDVRPSPAFREAGTFIFGALRRPPGNGEVCSKELPRDREIVLYCDDGRATSPEVATAMASPGAPVRVLEGGLQGWMASGGSLLPKPQGGSTLWVTRERPKIDRVACPWLISRFVDRDASFRYVNANDVKRMAKAERAIPFDIPDVTFSHEGDHCSFDAFVKTFRLDDPALASLAVIIRGADTGHLNLAPEAAGLLALALGLSRLSADDHEVLRHGMIMYDALYLWSREGRQETHIWDPDLYQ